MAFTFGFYNSLNGDRKYDAVQLSQIFDGIITDGVYETFGNAMMIRESQEENEVIVQTGRAWFNHTWNYNDSDLPLTGPQSDVYLNRYDAVVLDIQSDSSTRENSIIWITGETSTNPQKPTMIHTDDHNQYPLAYIFREANTKIITQAVIENTVGTSECPFVTGIIEGLDTDDLIAQWDAQYTIWKQTHTEDFDEWSSESRDDFNEWFANLQYVLDGDVAGHLQNEIDGIVNGTYVIGSTVHFPFIDSIYVNGSTVHFPSGV